MHVRPTLTDRMTFVSHDHGDKVKVPATGSNAPRRKVNRRVKIRHDLCARKGEVFSLFSVAVLRREAPRPAMKWRTSTCHSILKMLKNLPMFGCFHFNSRCSVLDDILEISSDAENFVSDDSQMMQGWAKRIHASSSSSNLTITCQCILVICQGQKIMISSKK
jgi:hypothetical protein